MGTPFKLKSGNTPLFKMMGSSPAKQPIDPPPTGGVSSEEKARLREEYLTKVSEEGVHKEEIVKSPYGGEGSTETKEQQVTREKTKDIAYEIQNLSGKDFRSRYREMKDYIQNLGFKTNPPGIFASRKKKESWLMAMEMRGRTVEGKAMEREDIEGMGGHEYTGVE